MHLMLMNHVTPVDSCVSTTLRLLMTVQAIGASKYQMTPICYLTVYNLGISIPFEWLPIQLKRDHFQILSVSRYLH